MVKIYLTFSLVLLSLFSCYDYNLSPQNNAVSVRDRHYSSPAEEARAVALPINELDRFPKDIKDKRAASVILLKYVEIKNDLYTLNISMKDAKQLGVDEDLYMGALKDLEASNKAIVEARKRGDTLELPDPKEEYKKCMNMDKTIKKTS